MDIASTLSAATGGKPEFKTIGSDDARLAEDFDNFLTLLTTQLQHQNPLEPMDSTEFVNQLVSFTQVEQAIKSNKQLEAMLDMQATSQAIGALNYMGQTVVAEGDRGPLAAGKAEFTYSLPEQAKTTSIGVFDAAGTMVFSADGSTTEGGHGFVWDGKDGNGNQLPDGIYRIAVSARDADGASIAAITGVVARVTGVQTTEDGTLLSLGGATVAIDKVRAVRETQTTPPAT